MIRTHASDDSNHQSCSVITSAYYSTFQLETHYYITASNSVNVARCLSNIDWETFIFIIIISDLVIKTLISFKKMMIMTMNKNEYIAIPITVMTHLI